MTEPSHRGLTDGGTEIVQCKRIVTLGLTLTLGALPQLAAGQEREDRTLLTQAQMTWIINEVSGDRAMQHVLEQVQIGRAHV